MVRVRKWLVRGLVFTLLLGMGCAAILYQRWTDPVAVREQVMTSLAAEFPGAHVTLEAARLRILGGILITDLRLIRRDDATRADFAYIPSAIVYHDKEQLLEGRLAFRKVELHRPRLRIIRESDGRWNLAGLTGPSGPATQLPTIVVHEGTLSFEDRQAGATLPPLEISGVSLTIINDPLSTVLIEGNGESTVLGRVMLKGTWQRDTGRLDLAVQTDGGELTPKMIRRLARTAGSEELRKMELHCKAAFHLDLAFTPSDSLPWHYDAQCHLRDGKLTHPRLPLVLEKLAVDARCTDGRLAVQTLTAASEETRIEAHGKGLLPDLVENFSATLTLKHVLAGDALADRLPPEAQGPYRMFQPRGPMTVRFDVACEGGKWLRQHCLLLPEKVAVCYAGFRYPLTNVIGTLDLDLLRQRVDVDLHTTMGTQALTIKGFYKDWNDGLDADLSLEAENIPLDETVIKALPLNFQGLARSFHTQGLGDVRAHIRHVPGPGDFTNEYHVHFHDATVQWDTLPYLLTHVFGDLHILPDHWEFNDFHGLHGKGQVAVQGRSFAVKRGQGDPNEQRLVIQVGGRDIELARDLRVALKPMPYLARAWDTLAVGGRLDFQATIDKVPGRPEDMNVTADVHEGRIAPRFFRYPLHDLSGHFHYGKNRLEMTNLRARHLASRVCLTKGTVDLSPGGGFYADLVEIQGNPVYLNDGFVQALPAKVQSVFDLVDQRNPVALRTRLVIAQKEEPGSIPDTFWDGLLWVRDTTLKLGLNVDHVTGVVACRGRYDGQQLHGMHGHVLLSEGSLLHQDFKDVHAELQVYKKAPEVLLVGLKAPVHGGDVSGQVRVDFASVPRYELNLTASQIDLEQFGWANLGPKSQLQGQASARLHLTGRGSSVNTLDGNGNLDVPQGKLLNLPLLLDLLKFLGLRWPDRTMFEEAHANFSIHGDRLTINRLDLWGNVVSLTGQGDVKLNGTDLNLDCYPSWARVEQLLPPAMRPLSPAVSRNLLKIEVRGKVGSEQGDLKFYQRPVPVLLDPLRQLRDRVLEIEHNNPFSIKSNESQGR
jgi:hypothetical protein